MNGIGDSINESIKVWSVMLVVGTVVVLSIIWITSDSRQIKTCEDLRQWACTLDSTPDFCNDNVVAVCATKED